MTNCTVCGNKTDRTYWKRLHPNDVLCSMCWRIEDVDTSVIRNSIARIIWAMRKENRLAAKEVMKGLRGKGVPSKHK